MYLLERISPHFILSVSYLNNEGITVNSNYERLTGRLKADYQVKDWLKVGANMAYTYLMQIL